MWGDLFNLETHLNFQNKLQSLFRFLCHLCLEFNHFTDTICESQSSMCLHSLISTIKSCQNFQKCSYKTSIRNASEDLSMKSWQIDSTASVIFNMYTALFLCSPLPNSPLLTRLVFPLFLFVLQLSTMRMWLRQAQRPRKRTSCQCLRKIP